MEDQKERNEITSEIDQSHGLDQVNKMELIGQSESMREIVTDLDIVQQQSNDICDQHDSEVSPASSNVQLSELTENATISKVSGSEMHGVIETNDISTDVTYACKVLDSGEKEVQCLEETDETLTTTGQQPLIHANLTATQPDQQNNETDSPPIHEGTCTACFISIVYYASQEFLLYRTFSRLLVFIHEFYEFILQCRF